MSGQSSFSMQALPPSTHLHLTRHGCMIGYPGPRQGEGGRRHLVIYKWVYTCIQDGGIECLLCLCAFSPGAEGTGYPFLPSFLLGAWDEKNGKQAPGELVALDLCPQSPPRALAGTATPKRRIGLKRKVRENYIFKCQTPSSPTKS